MADPATPLPAQLLSYLGLVGVVAVRRVPNIMGALVLVLQIAVQDLMEDLRRFLEANWTDMVRFATGRMDIEYYETELANGDFNDLLVEAACRMKNIQLLVRHLGAPANTSRIFGTHGPLYELLEVGGQWFALQQSIAPWSETALMSVAQEHQSQTTEHLEVVDAAGPSGARSINRRSRQMTESMRPMTLKRTSRRRHLNFEVISTPVPSHVRSILTVAKRLSDRARRTLLSRVHFNPVAVVTDISPLADKVPNVVRLPDDTVRQDDGDALVMIRAEEVEESGNVATQEEQVAEVVEGSGPMGNEVAEEPEAAQEDEAAEVVEGNGPVENEMAQEPEAAQEDQAADVVEGNEREEDVMAQEPEVEEAARGGEGIEEQEAVANGETEVDRAPEAEVIELQGPAFELRNSRYVCRLPGCPASDRGFATLKGWKIHASRTWAHQNQGYCTGCGHYVVMPPHLEDNEKKIWLDSHRRERCEGASRAILKERRLEKQRLEALWRDASHIKLPDDEDEAQARRAQKRAYPTEDERRAGVCLAYIKHMKITNPVRLDEVAADFQLTVL